MERKQSHAIYHQLYSKCYPVMDAEVCQYCGTDIDLSVDHVPALTTAQLYASRKDIDFILIVSCMECNQLLSNDLLPLFNDRFFTLKERLLKRYKKDLLNEFRNGFNWSEEYLREADTKFNRMLDRIGFGMVRFSDLNEEAQATLALKIDTYDETIGNLVAYRSGGGLLSEDNNCDDTNIVGEVLEEQCSFAKFLQIVSFQKLTTQGVYEQWLSVNQEFKTRYLLPDDAVKHYQISWSDLWKEAEQLQVESMPPTLELENYCSYEEFLEVMIERELRSCHLYQKWFNENLWGAVIALDMPEAPEYIYHKNWSEIEYDIQKVIVSESSDASGVSPHSGTKAP